MLLIEEATIEDVKAGDLVKSWKGSAYAIKSSGADFFLIECDDFRSEEIEEVWRPERCEVPVFDSKEDQVPVGFARDRESARLLLRNCLGYDVVVGGDRRKSRRGKWNGEFYCKSIIDDEDE